MVVYVIQSKQVNVILEFITVFKTHTTESNFGIRFSKFKAYIMGSNFY